MKSTWLSLLVLQSYSPTTVQLAIKQRTVIKENHTGKNGDFLFQKADRKSIFAFHPSQKSLQKWQKKCKNKSIVMLETKRGTYPSVDLNSRNFCKLKSKQDQTNKKHSQGACNPLQTKEENLDINNPKMKDSKSWAMRAENS